MAAFDACTTRQAGSLRVVGGVPRLLPIRRLVVVVSGIVLMLARVFLRIYKCNHDDCAVWEACQEHLRCLFQKILPIIHCFSQEGRVGEGCNLASGGGFRLRYVF